MLRIKSKFICDTWHVGMESRGYTGVPMEYVQADGDELNYIIDRFPNLLYPKGKKIVTWYGETAQFIAENLT